MIYRWYLSLIKSKYDPDKSGVSCRVLGVNSGWGHADKLGLIGEHLIVK